VRNGFRFDSITEADFYSLLCSDSKLLHIDVHPKVTIGPGIQYAPDFITYKKDEILVYDVKSPPTAKKYDFKLKKKLFDQTHPFAPLIVVMRNGKHGWKEST